MDYDELLNTAAKVGYRLLENGGEVYRVEESIQRMVEAYGVQSPEVFAIPSCIIVTICDEQGHSLTKIKRIHSLGIDLNKVDRYNDLCRRICRDKPEFSEIRAEIETIDQGKTYHPWLKLLIVMPISFAFTLFYGGTLLDALCSMFCGLGLKLNYNAMNRFHTNTFFNNIISSAIAAGIAILGVRLGFGNNMDKITIGALMNLVPGVAFTNFMRDIIAGDLIAGLTKLTESLLIATAIALGAGIAISVSRFFWGGL